MGWQAKKIGCNTDRLGAAMREKIALDGEADKSGGRGYNSVATAVEAGLAAFGNNEGALIQVETTGCISSDGKGCLTIIIQTLDPAIMVHPV